MEIGNGTDTDEAIQKMLDAFGDPKKKSPSKKKLTMHTTEYTTGVKNFMNLGGLKYMKARLAVDIQRAEQRNKGKASKIRYKLDQKLGKVTFSAMFEIESNNQKNVGPITDTKKPKRK